MTDRSLTASEMADHLKAAAKQNERDKVTDNAVDKLSRMFKHMSPYEQMIAIAAYQAALILELAEYDTEKALPVWQASQALSGSIINQLHQKAVDDGEAMPHGTLKN